MNLDDALKKATPKLALVDSSAGIKDVMEYSGEELDHERDAAKKDDEGVHTLNFIRQIGNWSDGSVIIFFFFYPLFP